MALIKSIQGNPDPFATFETKKTDEYGLQVGNVIATEWFNGNVISQGSDSAFSRRRDYVRNKRLFVRGEQSTQPYKNHVSAGNLEFMNTDWTIINLVEKFCRLVSNRISDENYVLDIKSTDFLSLKKKEDKINEYRKDMYSKPLLEKANALLGIDLRPKGFVAEDEEEIQLLAEIKDRPKIEIAEEIIINYVKDVSDYEFIEKQKNIDAVDVGLLIARVYTDKNDGVKVTYVDPENYIHSEVKRNDFADKYYEVYVDTITLSDLRRESNGQFTDAELRQIAQIYTGLNKGISITKETPIESIIDYKIDVLRFAFKTSKTLTFKKKVRNGKTVRVSKKTSDYIAPERSDVGMITKTLDTWFEGNYVIGANAIYDYKECENLSRDIMNKAMSPFVTYATNIYENRPQSFLTKIEPIAVQLQNDLIKLQNLLAELTPDLKEVDLDMLAELDDGKGGAKKEVWQTAMSLLQVKGIIFTKRIDMGEMGVKEKGAVRPSTQSQGSAIGVLLNAIAFKYNMIRDITGVNPAADGSLSQDALLGVNQMAQLASNTATRHIVEATIAFNKKVSELISTKIHGIFKNKEAKHLKEIYTNVVGRQMLEAMEVLADRHLHEFGFVFRMKPTQEQIREFKEDLSLAIQDGSIDVEVKSMAVKLAETNMKLAHEYLFYQRRKRNKARQEEQMLLAKNKSENDAMAAQAKSQSDAQTYNAKKMADLQYEAQLSKLRIMEAKALMEINQPKEDKEFQQEVYLKQIDGQVSFGKERFKEDEKEKREKQRGTIQSKLIKQRIDKSNPIDFEEAEFESLFEQ